MLFWIFAVLFSALIGVAGYWFIIAGVPIWLVAAASILAGTVYGLLFA